MVSLSTAESELYAAVKTGSEGLGIQSVAKDLGMVCGLSLHLGVTATMCLVNRRGAGQGKTRRHAELVDTRSLQVKMVCHEEGEYEREPHRLHDETTGTKDRAADENHGL